MMKTMKKNITEAFKSTSENISDLLDNLLYTEESDMFELNELLENLVSEANSEAQPSVA